MLIDFVKGIIVGLCASIPLGPIGVLCVQRTLSKGRNSGFFTGMGTAVTDTFFAAIALFSLSFVNDFINDYRNYILLIGGIIISAVGVNLFLTNPVKRVREVKTGKKRYVGDFFSAVLMTISNPGALFLLLGVFAFVGIDIDRNESGFIIASTLWGVFLGGTAWWFTLSTIINVFRNKFRLRQLLLINRISGVIIVVLGMISTFEAIMRFLAQ
jgi:threonine/homoserine/homoserine lactone efflux protein